MYDQLLTYSHEVYFNLMQRNPDPKILFRLLPRPASNSLGSLGTSGINLPIQRNYLRPFNYSNIQNEFYLLWPHCPDWCHPSFVQMYGVQYEVSAAVWTALWKDSHNPASSHPSQIRQKIENPSHTIRPSLGKIFSSSVPSHLQLHHQPQFLVCWVIYLTTV